MNLWYKGALELAAAIRDREISAVETLDLYLDRIDRFNPELNAIVVFDTEAAREAECAAGAALTAGHTTAPPHGVPMTVKISFDLRSTGPRESKSGPRRACDLAAEGCGDHRQDPS